MAELYDEKAVYLLYDLVNVSAKRATDILDAVAPLIAAKAVRQAARDLSVRLDAERISRGDLFSAMSAIADEIEEKAK